MSEFEDFVSPNLTKMTREIYPIAALAGYRTQQQPWTRSLDRDGVILDNGPTIMPNELSRQQPINRFEYLIFPFRKYGQAILATRAGVILQKRIKPFGVDGGTRSKAAERIITYNTAENFRTHSASQVMVLTVVKETEQEK